MALVLQQRNDFEYQLIRIHGSSVLPHLFGRKLLHCWGRKVRAWVSVVCLVGVIFGSSLPPVFAENTPPFSTDLSVQKHLTLGEQLALLRKPPVVNELPNYGFPAEGVYIEKQKPLDERLAQFQLPQHKAEMFRRKGKDPPSPLNRYLQLEYSYGSESEVDYRRNPNLDTSVKDDLLIIQPELNGYLTYRPFEWLEATLEVIFAVDIRAIEQGRVTLPNGDVEEAQGTSVNVVVDQAFVTFKQFIDPFKFSIGRMNFEDDRHWLYDTSLDTVMLSLNWGKFRAELSGPGREGYVDWNFSTPEGTDRINTYMLYGEYRGIEDIKLAAYTIFRDDLDVSEGQPVLLGLRSLGSPTLDFRYWVDLAYMTGRDDVSQRFSGFGIDFGATYTFASLPFRPNLTLGFAFGSGNDPNTETNTEFRQTGLQSNETRFAGFSEFKVYGEALNPQLTNIMIFTTGLGFKATRDISVDFVYHRYWLDEFAEELRNSGISALMNERSKDVGNGFDIVVGLRNLFGVRRLAVDLRGGWFFPGKAFRVDEGDGQFRNPDRAAALVAKFWW